MRYTKRNPDAARAYLARRLASGSLKPPRAGKPPAQYTDAYAVRLANSVSGGHGRKVARGHRETREHPRQFTVEYVDGQSRRRGSRRFETGHRQFREYRDPSALLRWMQTRIPAGTPTRISAHGLVRETYAALAMSPQRFAAVMSGDERERYEWRSIYTGDQSGDMDLNDVEIRSIADVWSAVNRVFVPGTVDVFQLNWH